jgi:pilus assembly protein CpaB
MGRRTLLLIAALVVAALGTTGVFLYVNGVDERASADYTLVKILVATAPIPAGMTGQQASDLSAIDTREYLKKSIDEFSAMSDISAIADKAALAPIAVGEPILASQFGDPADASALIVPEGKLAVSIQLNDPQRVAGFVGPGSDVAILLTGGADAAGGAPVTRVLLPSVQVLAAGTTTVTPAADGTETEQLPKTILTLAVDQNEAQKIVFGSQNGTMYFALRGKDVKVDPSDPGATAKNLFN